MVFLICDYFKVLFSDSSEYESILMSSTAHSLVSLISLKDDNLGSDLSSSSISSSSGHIIHQ